MRDRNKLASKAFRQELLDRYDGAKNCVCCGEPIDEPIWHHILPCHLGGSDLVTNIVPVCHSCHQAIHNMKPNIYYRFRSMGKTGGRNVDYKPEYDDIFDDYIKCRISRTEASKRLNKGVHFKDNKAFKQFMEKNGIESFRNNIDVILSKHDRLQEGQVVGYIKYADGRKEELKWVVETEDIPQPEEEQISAEDKWWNNYKKIKYGT